MRIGPNYSQEPICWFCEKRVADKDSEVKNKFYKVTGGTVIPLGYSYFTCEVGIPCCKECSKEHQPHNIVAILGIILFIIPFVYVGVFVAENFGHFVALCVPALMVSALLIGGLALIHSAIRAPSLKKLGIKPIDDINDYPPIKLLREYGFSSSKPDPSSKGGFIGMSEKDEWDRTKGEFYKKLSSIPRNCVVKRIDTSNTTDVKRVVKTQQQITKEKISVIETSQSQPQLASMNELKELSELFKQGVITEEEFTTLKSKIINRY